MSKVSVMTMYDTKKLLSRYNVGACKHNLTRKANKNEKIVEIAGNTKDLPQR